MTPLVWVAHDFACCEAVCAQWQVQALGAGRMPDVSAGIEPGETCQRLTWSQALRGLKPQAAWSRCEPQAQVWVLEPSAGGRRAQEAGDAFALLKGLGRAERPVWSLVLQPEPAGPVWRWLDAGADRVLPQGVDQQVLGAFLRALLRRAQGSAASQTEVAGLRFDHPSATLFHGQQRVLLTARETQLAALFFERGQQLVRTRDILRHLLTQGPPPNETVHVSLQVHRLNRKLRPYGVELVCLRGHGYRLAECMPQGLRPAPVTPRALKASPRSRPASVWTGPVCGSPSLPAWPPAAAARPTVPASGVEGGQ